LQSTDDCYFGGEVEEELLLLELPLFLWCFFALLEEVEDELEGAEAEDELDEDGGGQDGDQVLEHHRGSLRKIEVGVSVGSQNARIMPGIPRGKCHMTAT
jgi:hypothetical protein